jgi:cyclic pyranopterin phosphate synthase
MIRDSFGRTINYLRISITDRCNLRCVYCMPEEGIRWQPRQNLLSGTEIVQIVRCAAELGISRVRLTGGEPLVRPDVVEIVDQIFSLPGIEEVTLTTNGLLLERLAPQLARAGLRRVNISLDTLNPEKFSHITRGGRIERVFAGLAAAEQAGLEPIKINTVVVRGVNDDELLSLANLSTMHPWHIRFIELMPVGNGGNWGSIFPPVEDRYISVQEMRTILAPLKLTPMDNLPGSGPARSYHFPGAFGSVGFISPLGEHFCQSCNRVRLTSDGKLRACLLLDGEIDLVKALRSGQPIQPLFLQAIREKPSGHELLNEHYPSARRMVQIGG